MSDGPLGLPDFLWPRGPVEVFPDGVVVHGCGQGHKHVPNGVGERYHPVRFEEEHPQAVDEATASQLMQTIRVVLPMGDNMVRNSIFPTLFFYITVLLPIATQYTNNTTI